MCGRYSLVCIDDLGNRFRVHNPMIGSRSHFNICPASEMPVIVRRERDEIALMRWGLVPHGAKGLMTVPGQINARAETLGEKPMFASLLRSGRCLVPASGFYEWKKVSKRRVPFYFTVRETPIIAFAGLYDSWTGPAGKTLLTFTIITCEPNALVADVHDRMPVILARQDEEQWLSGKPIAPGDLARILAPFPAGAMEKIPVADLVNNPALNDERLVQPLGSSHFTQTFLTE